jgi:hypothetical protein
VLPPAPQPYTVTLTFPDSSGRTGGCLEVLPADPEGAVAEGDEVRDVTDVRPVCTSRGSNPAVTAHQVPRENTQGSGPLSRPPHQGGGAPMWCTRMLQRAHPISLGHDASQVNPHN